MSTYDQKGKKPSHERSPRSEEADDQNSFRRDDSRSSRESNNASSFFKDKRSRDERPRVGRYESNERPNREGGDERRSSYNPNFTRDNRRTDSRRDDERPRREYNRDENAPRDNYRKEGGFNREGGFRKEGGFNRDSNREGGYRKEGGFNRDSNRDNGYRKEGGFNRDSNREGGYRKEGGFNRDNNREGGFRKEGGFNRDSNREGGFRKEGGFNRDSNRDNGYRKEGGFNRDSNREGGYRKEGGFNRDSNREGGYRKEGGFNRDSNREGGFRKEGGFNREGGRGNGFRREGSRDGRYNDNRKRDGFKTYDKDNYPRFEPAQATGAIRLNRFIANSGICSRREADELIQAGVVTVNGQVITELGSKVNPSDEIRFNGEIIRGEKKVYILMNKPRGYVTSLEDPHADKTVMDLLKDACTERVYPVGRLDKNSVGVLLFTNDGELTRQLTHPSYSKKKIYQVSLDKAMTQADMQRLADGVELEDGLIFADEISYVAENRKEVGIEIHSGRNRIVRRMFESLGYTIQKLDRVYFGGLTKKALKRGAWRFLTPLEVSRLKSGEYE